ncbi:hypothetical protein P7K49_004765 [Saguinus oedipus]|uniref:Uncharacterized protein n=1 Tax=Saguinus oedipus TaxID=9490 RepID=A0ABQ9WAU0_SAGOE|nr:hypothetical protein P7K49_004765 [Saguinus oedipus]
MSCGITAHRSSPLKQQNKAHKGGWLQGRGSAQQDGKGRLALKTLSKKMRKELSRVDQRHPTSQLQKQKKEVVLAEKRQLGSRDGLLHRTSYPMEGVQTWPSEEELSETKDFLKESSKVYKEYDDIEHEDFMKEESQDESVKMKKRRNVNYDFRGACAR